MGLFYISDLPLYSAKYNPGFSNLWHKRKLAIEFQYVLSLNYSGIPFPSLINFTKLLVICPFQPTSQSS